MKNRRRKRRGTRTRTRKREEKMRRKKGRKEGKKNKNYPEQIQKFTSLQKHASFPSGDS